MASRIKQKTFKLAVHFSSASMEWGTPRPLFAALNKVHHYTLDAAATAKNALCKRFFTKEQDALAQKWTGRVFVNPPYSRKSKKNGPGTDAWIEKGAEAVKLKHAELVTLLLPARTSNHGFYDRVFAPLGGPRASWRGSFGTYVRDFTWGPLRWTQIIFGATGVTMITFERGRVKFVGSGTAGAPFPSVWVHFMSYDYYKRRVEAEIGMLDTT